MVNTGSPLLSKQQTQPTIHNTSPTLNEERNQVIHNYSPSTVVCNKIRYSGFTNEHTCGCCSNSYQTDSATSDHTCGCCSNSRQTVSAISEQTCSCCSNSYQTDSATREHTCSCCSNSYQTDSATNEHTCGCCSNSYQTDSATNEHTCGCCSNSCQTESATSEHTAAGGLVGLTGTDGLSSTGAAFAGGNAPLLSGACTGLFARASSRGIMYST